MILLQVIEATNTLMQASKEQSFLVLFLIFIIVVLGALVWWYMKKIEEKNSEINDCLKQQIRTEQTVSRFATEINEKLSKVVSNRSHEDQQAFKNQLSEVLFMIRNNINTDEK